MKNLLILMQGNPSSSNLAVGTVSNMGISGEGNLIQMARLGRLARTENGFNTWSLARDISRTRCNCRLD